MPTLPSGFSVDNEISLFEALDIPMTDTGYTIMDQLGTVRRGLTVNPSQVVKGEIETYLNNASECPPEKITRIVKYLTQWDSLTLLTQRIINGNVGDITNVTQDYREAREIVRQRLRVLVPFYDRYTLLKKLAEGQEPGMPANTVGSTFITH
jgi:hypothetical protein